MENNLLDDFSNLKNEELQLVYADFLERFSATILDGVAVYLLLFPILGTLELINLFISLGFYGILIEVLILLLYYPILESSKLQGSFGKHLTGMKVVDGQGNRISLGLATARFALKFVSLIIAFLGFASIAFTEKRQGLHDMLLGTYVVKK